MIYPHLDDLLTTKLTIYQHFAATATGKKLKPVIVIPRVKPLNDFVPPENVVIIYASNGTFNESVISSGFAQKSLHSSILLNDIKDPVLVWDQAPCHKTSKVNQSLVNINAKQLFVPARLTNLLQPADVCWMRVLKHKYHQKWQTWMLEENLHT